MTPRAARQRGSIQILNPCPATTPDSDRTHRRRRVGLARADRLGRLSVTRLRTFPRLLRGRGPATLPPRSLGTRRQQPTKAQRRAMGRVGTALRGNLAKRCAWSFRVFWWNSASQSTWRTQTRTTIMQGRRRRPRQRHLRRRGRQPLRRRWLMPPRRREQRQRTTSPHCRLSSCSNSRKGGGTIRAAETETPTVLLGPRRCRRLRAEEGRRR